MSETSAEAQVQKYLRILAYVKPYKTRLIIGILAGFAVGGSLFGTLMMIPNLASGIQFTSHSSGKETVQTAQEITKAVRDAAPQGETAQTEAVTRYLLRQKKAGSDKIQKEVRKIDSAVKKIGFKQVDVRYEKGDLQLLKNGKTKFIFPAETETGKMTWQFFSIFCIGLVLLWIIKNIATYVNHYCMRWVGQRVIMDLRAEIFRKLLRQSLSFYSRNDVGQLISRCTNDTGAIESSVANVIADATRCPLEILACALAIVIASLQYQSWSLPFILFIGLPLCILPVAIISRKIRKTYKRSFAKIAEVTTRMHEAFSGILAVKAYHAEDREINRFDTVNRSYFRTVIRALRWQLLMPPLMEVVAVTSTLVFLVYSYGMEVPLTELVQLLAPCFLAYRPIKDLAKVATYLQRSMAAADRYFQIIDTHTELPEAPEPKAFREFHDRIRLRNVSFAYDTQKILDGVSFDIPKGSIVAAVGETGSGKTTIANLIARFYDCSGGAVEIDGVNVKDFSIADLRNMIGIVTQDSQLFNDSIADNIAYGAPQASREEVIEAARQANAHDFIVDGRHPEGYETLAGEKGFKLSGGERQRISIARAILKNPPILILDEATSALDTVTEKLVQEALNRVMVNRTVFVIAHRLSTIRNADCILVLDKGRIAESGTHDELMALGGRYKKLCDTQFAGMQES